MDNKLKNTPLFIPKITYKEIFNLNTDISAVLLEAHHSKWRPSLVPTIKEKNVLFFLDPVTNMVMYKNSRDKINYKKLPYSVELDFEKFYADSQYRNNDFLIPCLDFQKENNPDYIIAPYLFSDNPWDSLFSINLTMIAESKKYLEDKNIKKPLLAMITINPHILEKTIAINYIIDRYTDSSLDYLNGYFILTDCLDCMKSDYSQLFGLANLVYQLSNRKNVFYKQIGGFGEILCAIGLTGFVSGLNTSETFSSKNLERDIEHFKKHNRVYIPELFTFINIEDAKKINYKCNCSVCNGIFDTSSYFQNNHYLNCKITSTNNLSKLNKTEKINYMIIKLEEAKEFAEYYRKKVMNFNPTYLSNWKQILLYSKNWSFTKQDSIDLENLLKDLESK